MIISIIALLLFLAMVAAWVVLPGSVAVPMSVENTDVLPANAVGQTV